MSASFHGIEEMKNLIVDELPECEFDEDFKCESCCELQYCYHKASAKLSHEFAESLDYGGYDTEEKFWENLD